MTRFNLKPFWALRMVALAALPALLVIPAEGADPAPSRGDNLKTFKAMVASSKKGLDKAPAANVKFPGDKSAQVSGQKYQIDTGVPNVQLGMKVWMELTNEKGEPNGQYVNPIKHPWKPGERFYLWAESAVPVQLALFQNFPGGTTTKQVVPDEKYPESFATVSPGAPWRFPLRFKMDDTTERELMALVVARTDVEHLPLNSLAPQPQPMPQPGVPVPPQQFRVDIQASNDVVVNNIPTGDVVVAQGGTLKTKPPAKMSPIKAQQEALRGLYDVAAKHGKYQDKATKFTIDNNCDKPISTTPDDVAVLLFGAGKLGHLQIELNKAR